MLPSGRSRRRFVAVLWSVLLLTAARAPSAEEPPAGPVPPAEEEPAPAPRLLFRGFGNFDWLSRRGERAETFSVGQLDLFATAALADDVSVLAEVVLEAGPAPESQIVDVERFQLRYAPLDALQLSLGRMHTVLGYWNQTYHHGAWLQTTAFRPEVYRWEDEEGGGLLPVHEVGLRLSGAVPARRLRIEYGASVANGRAVEPGDVVMVQDPNAAKATSIWVGLAPLDWPGLELGGAVCLDTIPPRPGDPGREAELRERIVGGFLAFRGPRAELIAEAFTIRHEDERGGRAYESSGLYLQGAWTFGRVKPYYRFDRVERDEEDPYFHESVRSVRVHTLGVRLDPWERVAFKLEAARRQPRSGRADDTVAVQTAFTF